MFEAVIHAIFTTLGKVLERVLVFARPFFSIMNERYSFEVRNTLLEYNRVFSHWFHISSEGELEQVTPVLEQVLNSGKPTLIIFTSISVEKKINLLKKVITYHEKLFRKLEVA